MRRFLSALLALAKIATRAFYTISDSIQNWRRSDAKSDISVRANLKREAKKVVIYATFNASNKPEIVDYHVKILRENFDLVIIANNCSCFDEAFFYKNDGVDITINRENFTRDIGAFKDAYFALKEMDIEFEDITFLNDSIVVIDPPLFKKYCSAPVRGYLGSTFSFHKCFHGQSFLFRLTSKVFNDEAFSDFWKSIKPVDSRQYAVGTGEFGIFKAVQKATNDIDFFLDYSAILLLIKETSYRMRSPVIQDHINQFIDMVTNQDGSSKKNSEDSKTPDFKSLALFYRDTQIKRDLDKFPIAYEFAMDLALNDMLPFIKMELVSKGLASYVEFNQLIEDRLPEEIALNVMNQIRQMGTPHNADLRKKFKVAVGAA